MSSYQKIENEIARIQSEVTRLRKNKLDFDASYALSLVNTLLADAKKLNKKIQSAAGRATDEASAERNNISANIFFEREEEFISVAHSILKRKTMEALQSSREYSYEPFVTRLMEAVSNRNIVQLRRGDYGVSVEFLMEEVCGSVESYFLAVQEARKKNRKPKDPERTRKTPPKNPSSSNTIGAQEMASIFWAEKIYGVFEGKTVERTVIKDGEKTKIDVTSLYKGKYEKIIQERFNLMKDPAPFWYLLENGNFNYVGEGVAYPEQKPTRFSQEAQREAENEINRAINTLTIQEDMNSKTRVDRIFELEGWFLQLMKNLRQLANSYSNGLESFRTNLETELKREAYSKLVEASGGTSTTEQYIAMTSRVSEQVNRILAGEVVGRVDLGTYKGDNWSVRIRPRTIQLERKVASEITHVFAPIDYKEIEELSKQAKLFHEDYKRARKAMLKKKRY